MIRKSNHIQKINKALLTVVLSLASLTTLYPLAWMAYTSLKTNAEITLSTFSLPKALHFENYVNAWRTAKIGIYFFNSVFIAIVSIILTIVVGALAAFILAKFEFKLRKAIYSLFIVGMLIPMQSVLVPLFIQMRTLRLLDSPFSLILAYTAFGLPLTIFILESFIRAFPDSIIEAAIMDHCGMGKLFTQIILPMSRPALATVTILNFLNNWKEFSFALVFISSDDKKTLPLGLYNFIGAYSNNYAELMAAMMITSIPVIIIYLILQEQIINGMTAGAVKG
ncbi:MAG: sugar transporter permease [Clostridia bacterium]|nr:sugar transporter permease [Clostridia bacterium]